ncbi:MFS transporter [Streptomyces deccanensis]|uniref:MFS transporter n=1 Tax=Streptomyces deccanensis TaxID=424188 RepID=UPI001EFB49BB|nr:MFS transporter [Streptomyces deccanensis]ULR48450.1 MFS transporter [Streptomyces deccanensis]
MSTADTARHASCTAGLLRSIYLPRTADALAFAMCTYGIPLLVLATTRSAVLTGAAFALEWIPRLAAFAWAGSVVDRRGAAVVFHLASLGRALVLTAGAVLLHLHPSGITASVTVMALAATTGVLTEFSYIAAETAGAAAGRRAAARAHRVQAVLLGIDQTATLAGPALAGVLLLAGPPPMLAAITMISLLAAVLALRTPPSSDAPARVQKERSGAGLLTGWRTIRSLPALGWLVTGLTLSNLATGFLQAAGPVIVVERFGQSVTAVGLVWSAAAGATLLSVALCRFALDRLGLWPVGAACAAVASLACLAAAQAPDYPSYLVLVALLMAAEGGMTVVLRTLRSRLIPPEKFGSALSATILILLLPFPAAGVLTALTPPAALDHVITACAALQALGLFGTFARLRVDPTLRT